jgi:hypothetical protein
MLEFLPHIVSACLHRLPRAALMDRPRGETFPPAFAGFSIPRADCRSTSLLDIEHDPCWRMIAGVFLSTRPTVNTTADEAA